jgi:nitrite reductase (NO-forming)
MAKKTNTDKIAALSKHVAVLRIAFGFMWVVDASFKWRSSFRTSFLSQVQSAGQGQASWLHSWFNFWATLMGHNPALFAYMVAVVESLIALALLVGLARRSTYLAAALFSLLIWAIAEGFGGPYGSDSTDIGTGIVYAVVFLALYGLDRLAVPPKWSVDNAIGKKLPWWHVVANP